MVQVTMPRLMSRSARANTGVVKGIDQYGRYGVVLNDHLLLHLHAIDVRVGCVGALVLGNGERVAVDEIEELDTWRRAFDWVDLLVVELDGMDVLGLKEGRHQSDALCFQ